VVVLVNSPHEKPKNKNPISNIEYMYGEKSYENYH
jgi:hypothetical protein